MRKNEPSEELQERINDEEAEREWNWVKTRGEYIDSKIPSARADEFEKIWELIKDTRK